MPSSFASQHSHRHSCGPPRTTDVVERTDWSIRRVPPHRPAVFMKCEFRVQWSAGQRSGESQQRVRPVGSLSVDRGHSPAVHRAQTPVARRACHEVGAARVRKRTFEGGAYTRMENCRLKRTLVTHQSTCPGQGLSCRAVMPATLRRELHGLRVCAPSSTRRFNPERADQTLSNHTWRECCHPARPQR
jgi:hypothetical protein